MELEDKTSQAKIYTIDNCLEPMVEGLIQGKKKGTSTYISELDMCWKWLKKEFNIWTGYANEGKALDIETIIPTPNGPTFLRDIQVGNQVFDEQGKICNVTNVTDIMYDRPCYKITFSDNVSLIADENHQWVVDNCQSRASKIRQLNKAELKKRGTNQKNKCLKSQTKTTKELLESLYIDKKANYSIDLCKPAQYEKKNLLINPYLLGAWLGDGSKEGGQITSADIEILEEFKKEGFTITKHQNKYSYGILKFKVILRKLGLLKNKHIPFEYLHSSIEDRLSLLQGLMDTDGFTDELGRCEYTCTDWHLAEHVQYLISSLGIKIYFTEDVAKLNGKIISPRYRFRFKTLLPVFRLERKLQKQLNAKKPKNNCRLIKSIEACETVPVKCIEVDSPNHMYLCTEHYIPTHNSLFLRYLCLIKMLEEDWKFLFCAPEDFPPEEFFDDMIHTISGMSTDMDFANVISEKKYREVADKIRNNIYFVYIKPPHNTIKGVLEEFRPLIKEYGIDAAIIDPLLKFARPKGFSERDDIYAAYITTMCTDFAREQDISLHMVMHQLTPKIDGGQYPKPSMYSVKGGGSWSDGTDNILSIWRPQYATNKVDDSVMFSSQKIKKQKLVGIPQDFTMRFDRRTNRYIKSDGTDLYNFSKWVKKF